MSFIEFIRSDLQEVYRDILIAVSMTVPIFCLLGVKLSKWWYLKRFCLSMVVVREILFPLQNYNVVALTYIAAKTNIV